MTTYIYSGPPSGATLTEGDKSREVLLWPGKSVNLTPDHPYTLTLLTLNYLKEEDSKARAVTNSRKVNIPDITEVNDGR